LLGGVTINKLINIFQQSNEYKTILQSLRYQIKQQLITGLNGSSRQLLIATLYQELAKPTLVITHNLLQAQKVYQDLIELLPEKEILLYPYNEVTILELLSNPSEISGQRIEVIYQLLNNFHGILVIPYVGLRNILPPKDLLKENYQNYYVGMKIDIKDFVEQAIIKGYQRVEEIEKPGELSVRGGIVDIFPLTYPQPIRIEWFDIEIDSIRTFDVNSQLSLEKLSQITIPPAQELIADKNTFVALAMRVKEWLKEQEQRIHDKNIRTKLREKINWEIEQLNLGNYFPGIEKYRNVIYPNGKNIFNFFSEDSLIFFDEPARIKEVAEQIDREEKEWFKQLIEQGEYLPQLISSYSFSDAINKKYNNLFLSTFVKQISNVQIQNIIQFVQKPVMNFHGQLPFLKNEIDRFIKNKFKIIFLAADYDRAKRLKRILADFKIEAEIAKENLPISTNIEIMIGNLQTGFELPLLKLILFTEGEIFTQKQQKAKKLTVKTNAERIKSYLELKVGDYVVHVNHGIGRFLGIETLVVDGVHKDYLYIKYAGNDKLYVPIEQIDLVQKYTGAEDKEPKLYSLGGSEWAKVKNKVRSSVKDIAEDLIKLYAKRKASVGYSFSPDTVYQREFEALFPYEETKDQLRAIEEIKRDMERPYPMDRLLCGDVGYGKTEVAIRAAFKAVMDGKQVAVLVPTTILAQQHYETFIERFAGYPVKIEVLSRFRSRKEQLKTIKMLNEGIVDIVIGTHRLLSKEIYFKDLGLLIVDEEQRFGVTHKEKLKKLKANVDVLTLTATPIPRTLHMSMLGVRDLSVIETPPENRYPVQTFVMEYSNILVKEAIERELAREGQVYFLYNQVKSIQQMAENIANLVPVARIAVAHGQMAENELERIMLDFLEGEYDVLVSTTIIETGVDIPNVNTLIVYDADKMGLSQLYQLRGRVGRSNRIAFAYFTYQRDKVLTEVAEKRLQAIKEFTELGSGFKIAMRDLAIRGAGNLLGAEQHGFIASVGFELYSNMLRDAINELKGEEEFVPLSEPELQLNIDAYIPAYYIDSTMHKIEMYKKIAAAKKIEEIENIEEELVDRFGDLPKPVENLLKIAKIKAYAYQYKIDKIIQKGTEIEIIFNQAQSNLLDGEKLINFVSSEYISRVRLGAGLNITIFYIIKGMNLDEWLKGLVNFLRKLQIIMKNKGEKNEKK